MEEGKTQHLGPSLWQARPLRFVPGALGTCLFEYLLVWGHDGAQAVEDQGAEFQGVLLGALVIIQGIVREHEPALLQLQGGHLRAVLHLLVQPPWRGRAKRQPGDGGEELGGEATARVLLGPHSRPRDPTLALKSISQTKPEVSWPHICLQARQWL